MNERMKWDRSSREAMGQPTDHAAARLAPRDVVATWMVRWSVCPPCSEAETGQRKASGIQQLHRPRIAVTSRGKRFNYAVCIIYSLFSAVSSVYASE